MQADVQGTVLADAGEMGKLSIGKYSKYDQSGLFKYRFQAPTFRTRLLFPIFHFTYFYLDA